MNGIRHRWTPKGAWALDGLDIEVEQGTSMALVGPDGAGKTTLLRILCRLVDPVQGSISLFGADAVLDPHLVRRDVGYLAQRFSLYADLTVRENLEFFSDLYGVQDGLARGRHFLARMGMERFEDRLAAKLSGGMKQKLALTVSLLHRPKLLVLDEPTNGVDPVSRREFWDILRELVADGLTILVSTPYMDEAQRCDHIALLHQGRVLRQGTLAGLRQQDGRKILEILASNARSAGNLLRQTFPQLQVRGDRLELPTSSPDEDLAKATSLLRTAGQELQSHQVREQDLENLFLELLDAEVRHAA